MELEAGTVVAQRYRILRQLGRGGMGEVFAAENVRTGRVVAVKVLRADSKQKSSAVARFRREARAAGAINSDHVTQVLDVEEDTEQGIVIVFELLEGESLIDRLKRTGPMTFDELYPLVEQVWMGLADAHKAGVIHRDLKPSNVFLERRPDGIVRVKILDFGISKLPREVGGETLTEMGQSLGTFSFMPPEQIGKAKTVDHRADIYASATLIYQAMSGQLPYAAKNILQMVDLKTKSEPRPLSSVLDGGVDPRLEAFLAKGLAREPADRFQSAQEALEAWRELRRVTSAAPQAQPRSSGSSGTYQQYTGPAPANPSSAYSGMQPAPGPQYAGAAQNLRPQQPSQPPQQQRFEGPSSGRVPATVMLADPRSHAASPLPVNAPEPRPGFASPTGVGQPHRLGGTVAMNASPALGGAKPPINVPVMNDTSSEGHDHVATVAMPMRNVAQALNPAGIPRVHDDAPQGQAGTQLMSHAALRQAGVPMPVQQRGNSPSTMNPALTPMPGSSGAYPMPGSNPQPQGGQPQTGANLPPPKEEGGDLTTVYRRDKSQNGGPPPTLPQGPEGRGRNLWMILGVLMFALVGFVVAAVLLRGCQSGSLPWQ